MNKETRWSLIYLRAIMWSEYLKWWRWKVILRVGYSGILTSCIPHPTTHLPVTSPPGTFCPVRPCGPHSKRKHSTANKSQPLHARDETVLRLLSKGVTESENWWTGQRTVGRCTKYSGMKTFSCQKSKLQLAGGVRLTLSTSPIFANKLLAILHFSLGESVLIHLGAFLDPSHLLLLRAP